MRKLYIFGLIALVAVIIGLAFADQMTFTTYYPAPYGVYNNMRVMNSLGVGTTQPQGELDVEGSMRGHYLDLSEDQLYQEADPANMPGTEPGRMCYDKAAGQVKYYDGVNNRWAPFGGTGFKYVGTTVLQGVNNTGNWDSIDLSPYVGRNRVLVVLKIKNVGLLMPHLGFRPSDQNDEGWYAVHAFLSGTSFAGQPRPNSGGEIATVILPTGPDGKVEWKGTGAYVSKYDITLLGWI